MSKLFSVFSVYLKYDFILLIALALRTSAPIFGSEKVIKKQSSEELEQWLENLKPEDFGKLDT